MTKRSLLSTRRDALCRIGMLAAGVGLAGCGGGDESTPPVVGTPPPPPPAPPVPVPPPVAVPPPSPLSRALAALQRAPLAEDERPVAVTQGSMNSFQSSFGAGVQVFPPLVGNAQALTLATIAQIWGHRRDRWRWPTDIRLNGQPLYAITSGPCGLHFRLDGSAFEIYFGGRAAAVTLVANGRYMSHRLITTTLENGVTGVPLSVANTFVRFDFGSRAVREISAYVWSDLGPCAIAVGEGDTLQPWDRSGEASFMAVADSYGGGKALHWLSGPFWEAGAQLGFAHPGLNVNGGTGYNITPTYQLTGNPALAYTADPAYTFVGRLGRITESAPDIVLTCGGVNDNNGFIAVPYGTTSEAAAAFETAVHTYYRQLREALPDAVLAATGPWAPRQHTPTERFARAKADTVLEALRLAGGHWVFLDNLDGGWVNSAGHSAPGSGPWQTGTGTVAAPRGDGNADLYLSADGVHPTVAGNAYLAQCLATDLRAAVLALADNATVAHG